MWLGGKGCSLSMALEIPVASKLGTPMYLPPSLMQLGATDHIAGPIAKLYRRTMESCTSTKTITIIGQRLRSEQYQLETNG